MPYLTLVAGTLLAATAVARSPEPASTANREPHRQFDFWVGEWSVQNRHLQPDGSWRDGDVTRARITPVAGGMAVLEEWAGPFNGSYMNGFSLRAYDPVRADWNLLLSWTTDGNSTFGTLRGGFRHGRGEFYARGGEQLTRYSFSDALADTVRWDSATSADGGVTWKTDWIMEFTRTRSAAEVTQSRLFAVDWTEGDVSPHPEARALDWMVGGWSGTQVDAEGTEREARLACKTLNQGCLILTLLEVRTDQAEPGEQQLAVRGYIPARSSWESWNVTSTDSVLRRALGTPEADFAIFTLEGRDGAAWRETLIRNSEDSITIEEERRAPGAQAFETTRVTELERD